jgi:L-threonylcarbamoyladenylate synthase
MVRAGHRASVSAVRLLIDPHAPSPRALTQAATIIHRGGLVAFPTDTLYALGADASNDRAVERLFAAKGRGRDLPVPVLVADLAMATRIAGDLSEAAARLAARYWPGALTLVVPVRGGLPERVTAGTGRIGLRIPDSKFALALIRRVGGPITGTSANRSAGRDPRDAGEVFRQLGDRVDLVLDGGVIRRATASTVVDVTVTPPAIVRQGGIAKEAIFAVLGLSVPARADGRRPRS